MNGKEHKRKKRHIRSALSGKIVNGSGREIIFVEEAIDYVKKSGFVVKPISQVIAKAGLMYVLLIMFISLSLLPFISAQPAIFVYDFTEQANQVIMYLWFAIALFLFYIQQRTWSGTMVVLAGMMMAFNDINIIISLFVMGVGIILVSSD